MYKARSDWRGEERREGERTREERKEGGGTNVKRNEGVEVT